MRTRGRVLRAKNALKIEIASVSYVAFRHGERFNPQQSQWKLSLYNPRLGMMLVQMLLDDAKVARV
jgi:hypothetical protein